MQPIRLIAMDMDGTLLNSKQELTPGNIAALRAAEARGVKLAICSGRVWGDCALFAKKNGFENMGLLCLNGGYCLENPSSPAYVNHLMEEETARRCVAWLKEAKITFGAFLQNQIAVFPGSYVDEDIFWSTYRDEPGAPIYLEGEDAFFRAFEQGMNKITCIDADMEKINAMRKRLKALPELDVTSSWPGNLELMPHGITKGLAVCELAEKMGIGPQQVMTFGDYDNDITMIQYADYGVAMANATDSVKAVAKHVTLTNDEEGVAAAIRRFVLS